MYDVNWMDLAISVTISIVKVTKSKLGPCEHTVSMFKWPVGSLYIGNIIYYLTYLFNPFPKGLKVYLEGSHTFPILKLLMYNDR